MSFTPGPWGWVYDGSGDYSIGPADDPQGKSFASVRERLGGHRDWERAHADCNLIIAAPDMLDALKRLFETGLVRELDTPEEKAALAAIAKAEGR